MFPNLHSHVIMFMNSIYFDSTKTLHLPNLATIVNTASSNHTKKGPLCYDCGPTHHSQDGQCGIITQCAPSEVQFLRYSNS